MTGHEQYPRARAIVAAILVALWIGSGCIYATYGDGSTYMVTIKYGGIMVEWGPNNIIDIHVSHVNYVTYHRGWHGRINDRFFLLPWGVYVNRSYLTGSGVRFAAFPFWPIPALAVGCWFVPWRRWKRSVRDRHNCRVCEYNLTGNTSGICPECGVKCRALS